MPVFKVVNETRTSKINVAAGTLSDLKEKACLKLGITEVSELVWLYDDCDGSEIDEYEVLIELQKQAYENGRELKIMVLPLGHEWSAPAKETITTGPAQPMTSQSSNLERSRPPSPAKEPEGRVQPVQQASTSVASLSSPLSYNFVRAFDDKEAVEELNNALKSEINTRTRDLGRARRKAAKLISDHCKKIKDFNKNSCRVLCQQVHRKCPEAFKIDIGKTLNVDNGLDTFVRSAYNMLTQVKPNDLKNKQRQESYLKGKNKQGAEETTDFDDQIINENDALLLDDYGCVDGMWNPPLPDEETPETQEQKRVALLQYCNSTLSAEELNVKDLLQETYPSQRQAILKAKSTEEWLAVFAAWPIMARKLFVFCHSEKITGKNLEKIWYEEMAGAKLFVEFISSHLDEESKGKSKNCQHQKDVIREAREAARTQKSETPYCVAIFPLLVAHMKEDVERFYIVTQETATDQEVLNLAKETSHCPLLVVRGKSLFDVSAHFDVVVRGMARIVAGNAVEGFLLVAACYFAFSIGYPKSLRLSLEFIQRVFLRINPKKDSQKQVEGNKRKYSKVSAPVKRLAEKVSDFEQKRSRWSVE